MTSSLRIRAIFVIPMIVAGLLSVVPFASAAEAVCDCWCETKAGATKYPADSSKITRAACQEACPKEYPGYNMAVCAASPRQSPSSSLSCFTETQCTNQNGTFDRKYQPPECLAGSRYCYPDKSKAAKVTLSTSIAGLTVTGDLGEYIAKVYQWMIGSATLIAIVFIMVSGLRWTLGGLNAEQVKKAKKTISNAVIGLVLLLGSYLILFTVNPQLLKLQVPSFPLIRTIRIGEGTSCEALKEQGYTLEFSGAEECGTTADVLKDADGNEVAEGTTCDFMSCRMAAELCIPGGDKNICMTCVEMSADNPTLTPTSQICDAFNALPYYQQKQRNKTVVYTTTNLATGETATNNVQELITESMRYCFYTHDPSAGGELTGRGTCAQVNLNCETQPVKDCRDIERIPVEYNTGTTDLENIDIGKNSGIPGADVGRGAALYDAGGEITMGSFCGKGQFSGICEWNFTDKEHSCEIDTTDLIPVSSAIIQALSPSSYDCQ